MNCPNCIERMEPTTIGEYHTNSCIYCSGTWIDYKTLCTIVSVHSDNEDQGPYKSIEPKKLANPGKLICPSCEGTRLHAFKFGEFELDICKKCRGIFFDDGEIEELIGLPPEEAKSNLGLALAFKGAIFILTMGSVSGG